MYDVSRGAFSEQAKMEREGALKRREAVRRDLSKPSGEERE